MFIYNVCKFILGDKLFCFEKLQSAIWEGVAEVLKFE